MISRTSCSPPFHVPVADHDAVGLGAWGAVVDREPRRSVRAVIENLPRKTARRHVYLSADDVDRLADVAGGHRVLVLTLAYAGIRWGEAVALRVRDVEFLRGRLSVHANAVQLGVDHAVGPTKGRTARSVPVAAQKTRIAPGLLDPGYRGSISQAMPSLSRSRRGAS